MEMRMKVNCNLLAEAESELMELASRLQAVTDEITAAQRALLNSGDTFRQEVRAMDSRRRMVEREIEQTHSMANALSRLIELYADCERRLQNPLDIGAGLAAAAEIRRIQNSAVPMSYVSEEQFSKSYGDLISPLVGAPE